MISNKYISFMSAYQTARIIYSVSEKIKPTLLT